MRIPGGILFLLLMSAIACDDAHPAAPMAPSVPSQPTPAPARTLVGYVYDAAFRSVGGATATVIDGSQAGILAVTEPNGRFSMTAPFDTAPTLSVSRDAYITVTVAARAIGPGSLFASATLDAVAAPIDLVGNYTLTLIAAPSCADIPSELRTRTYPATIAIDPDAHTRPGSALVLTAAGATFFQHHDRFSVGVVGDTVGFSIYNGEDFGLVEQAAPATYLAVEGSASVSVGTSPVSTISTAFTGLVDYCAQQTASGWNTECTAGSRVAYSRCDSSSHQLLLSRR